MWDIEYVRKFVPSEESLWKDRELCVFLDFRSCHHKKREDCRNKPHDESRLIQRSFDDNKGDEKKLKGQEYFMITKMMISRIKEWVLDVQDWIKNTSRIKRKFDFKIQESSFKI